MAARAIHTALEESNASQQTLEIVASRISALEDLLAPVPTERDVLAGSLSQEQGEPPPFWEPLGDHLSTVEYTARLLRRFAGRVFEDREKRDEAIKIRTQLNIQRRLLRQMLQHIEARHRSEVEAKISALDFATSVAMGTRARPDGSEPSESNSDKQEIPID